MKTVKSTAMAMLLMLSLIPFSNAQIQPLTVRTRTSIISYLKSVIANNSIIVGQQKAVDGDAPQHTVESLRLQTGNAPALIGYEYGWNSHNRVDRVNLDVMKQWNSGGLVTISWHADNPFTPGYSPRWNSVAHKDSIDLKALLKNAPDSYAKSSYRKELEKVGNALLDLKNKGVVVLWRPFHEMNGSWFWWGINDLKNPTNQADYIALWVDMYNYFTNDLKLNNLIWVYSPNDSPDENTLSYRYPGSQYVDVVGIDIYSNNISEFKDYNKLLKFNKPIAICEVGPKSDAYGKMNELDIINTFKGKAAYFLQWSSWVNARVSIVDNMFSKEMMQNKDAVTLEKLMKKKQTYKSNRVKQ